MAVREEHDRFAIDQGIVDGQDAHRFRDPRKPVVEQGAAATPHLDARALLSGEDPEARVLDLMRASKRSTWAAAVSTYISSPTDQALPEQALQGRVQALAVAFA